MGPGNSDSNATLSRSTTIRPPLHSFPTYTFSCLSSNPLFFFTHLFTLPTATNSLSPAPVSTRHAQSYMKKHNIVPNERPPPPDFNVGPSSAAAAAPPPPAYNQPPPPSASTAPAYTAPPTGQMPGGPGAGTYPGGPPPTSGAMPGGPPAYAG